MGGRVLQSMEINHPQCWEEIRSVGRSVGRRRGDAKEEAAETGRTVMDGIE